MKYEINKQGYRMICSTNLQAAINLVFISKSNQTRWCQDSSDGFVAAYKYTSANKKPSFSYKDHCCNHGIEIKIKEVNMEKWHDLITAKSPRNEASETTLKDVSKATFFGSLLFHTSLPNSSSKFLHNSMSPGWRIIEQQLSVLEKTRHVQQKNGQQKQKQ